MSWAILLGQEIPKYFLLPLKLQTESAALITEELMRLWSVNTRDENSGIWRQDDTVQIPVLAQAICASLGRPLNFSVP